MEIRIDRAAPRHASEVIKCLHALYTELDEGDGAEPEADALGIYHAFNRKPGNIVFVAIDDQDRVVGVLTLEAGFAIYAGGAIGTIRELYVTPDYRNDGVGAMLLASAVDLAIQNEWKRLEVTCPEFPRWKRTRDFHLREGFGDAGPKLRYLMKT